MVYRKLSTIIKVALKPLICLMAQDQGFEPWRPVTDLQAFQACPFNRLGIPACPIILAQYRILPQELIVFLFKIRIGMQ